MMTCCRTLEFCAGHRVMNHESKCRNLHGHEYRAEVYAQAEGLDSLGRVIDFGVLKERVGGWIDTHWDHGCAVWQEDTEARTALAHIAGQRVFLLPANPTAENLAAYLLQEVCPTLLAGTGVTIVKVRLWETPKCFAEVSL